MLYLLMHSPYTCDLISLLRTVSKGDDILLLSDGVIAALKNSKAFSLLNISVLKLYALKNDVLARGLFNYVSNRINIIDYDGFIKLTEKHTNQISW